MSFREAPGAWALRTSCVIEVVGQGCVIFTRLFCIFTNLGTQEITGTDTNVPEVNIRLRDPGFVDHVYLLVIVMKMRFGRKL